MYESITCSIDATAQHRFYVIYTSKTMKSRHKDSVNTINTIILGVLNADGYTKKNGEEHTHLNKKKRCSRSAPKR